MNGHQLAEALEKAKSISEVARLVKEEVIPMLRQQQSEIEVLKEVLDDFGITIKRKAQEK
jgi:predicted regulator of amino acid metabolism with ACT domain